MSDLSRPNRSALIERARDDLNARIPGADSRLRRSTLNGLSAMHGGAMDAAYGRLDYVADQLFPDTANTANLLRFASLWGITPAGPTAAAGTATGAAAAIEDIPLGTVLQRGDGFQYATTADVVTSVGAVSLPIAAVTPGSPGVAEAGVVLTLVSPIAGVGSEFTVDGGGLAGGADAETPAQTLQRVLARIRTPPQGGCVDDYVSWATTVPGVTRVWVEPGATGSGALTVLFVCDGRDDIIPTGGDVAAVQAAIDAPSARPVTANVTVEAPTPVALNPHLALTPNTTATRAAATAAMQDLLARIAAPGQTIEISLLYGAVTDAQGVTNNVFTSPAADVTMTATEIAVLGTPVYS